MQNLIIVQHCQSEHHINGLTGGWTDTPLTELGRQQARQVALRLQCHGGIESFDLFSSDLLRAHQTAQEIGSILNKHIAVFQTLREMNLGSATGKTREWFDQHRRPLPRQGKLDHRMLDDAETIREHYNRVTEFLEALGQKSVENALVVTHGGVVPHIMFWWLGIPVDLQDSFYANGRPAGLTILSKDARSGGPVLNCFNDMSHL
jgi:broad specificity phosphatase PhoE